MTDFTDLADTPAQDFAIEMSKLIEKYLSLGLCKGSVEEIAYQAIEDMFDCNHDDG